MAKPGGAFARTRSAADLLTLLMRAKPEGARSYRCRRKELSRRPPVRTRAGAYESELAAGELGAAAAGAASVEAGADAGLSVFVAGALVSDLGGSDPVSDSLLLAA